MSIKQIYDSLSKTSPNFPLSMTDCAILFDSGDEYLVMYAEDLWGNVVHLLTESGYPKLKKEFVNKLIDNDQIV